MSEKRKRGRPTRYSRPIGKAICKMLANRMTLGQVCRRPLMPRASVVIAWAMNPKHEFAEQYATARLVGYHQMADELIEIADDGSNDWMLREGKMVYDQEAVARTRIRIDTRKWLLSKALPKIYGDKLVTEVTGKDGGPIETVERPQAVDSDHLAAITKRYMVKPKSVNVSRETSSANGRNGAANGSSKAH